MSAKWTDWGNRFIQDCLAKLTRQMKHPWWLQRMSASPYIANPNQLTLHSRFVFEPESAIAAWSGQTFESAPLWWPAHMGYVLTSSTISVQEALNAYTVDPMIEEYAESIRRVVLAVDRCYEEVPRSLLP